MNDCVNAEVRDALPDLVHGRLSELDTATMTAHVESCAECRAEVALLREISSSALLAPPMDVARIASALPPYGGAAVVRNLPLQPARRMSWRYPLLVAMGLAIIAIGGVSIGRQKSAPAAAVPVVAVSPAPAIVVPSAASEDAALPKSQTEQAIAKSPPRVKSGVAAERQVASLSLVGGTQDLNEAQLETLLDELDAMETLPSAEPQSVAPSIEDLDGNAIEGGQ